jgi:hypothetical protein
MVEELGLEAELVVDQVVGIETLRLVVLIRALAGDTGSLP